MQATASAKPIPVEVPGWGTVYVRQITVEEVEEQTADTEGDKDKRKFARAAARVMCDEYGKLLLDPKDPAQIALLATQPWSLLRRVLEASQPGDAGKA